MGELRGRSSQEEANLFDGDGNESATGDIAGSRPLLEALAITVGGWLQEGKRTGEQARPTSTHDWWMGGYLWLLQQSNQCHVYRTDKSISLRRINSSSCYSKSKKGGWVQHPAYHSAARSQEASGMGTETKPEPGRRGNAVRRALCFCLMGRTRV